VDRGGADRTSDRGWGAVVGATDGEQGRRRRSGEQWRSGQGNWVEGKCAKARTCTRGARGGARGPEETVPVRKQVLASAARVPATAELGLEQRDVEDAGQDSTRSVGRRRGSEWDVGDGSGAGLHGSGLCSSDSEVRCTNGRGHSGRRRMAWQGEGKPARGR
jgi:hypothetical protein